jgi:hypothetical protein
MPKFEVGLIVPKMLASGSANAKCNQWSRPVWDKLAPSPPPSSGAEEENIMRNRVG